MFVRPDLKHGVPARIIHDRAAEFLAEVLQETATLLGVTQLPILGPPPNRWPSGAV